MAFASIQDIAASWDLYRSSLAQLIGPGEDGLILHLAGPTDEGIRAITVWESEAAYDRFHACEPAAVLAVGRGPARVTWTIRNLRPAHVVLGPVSPTALTMEAPSC